MAVPIQKLREVIFQMIFSLDFCQKISDDLVCVMMKELHITKKNAKECLEKAQKIYDSRGELDALIAKNVTSCDIDRIQAVERNILRVSVYECMVEKIIPVEIAIAEAKRLVRKFGNLEAENFVQALLDAICRVKVEEQDVSTSEER